MTGEKVLSSLWDTCQVSDCHLFQEALPSARGPGSMFPALAGLLMGRRAFCLTLCRPHPLQARPEPHRGPVAGTPGRQKPRVAPLALSGLTASSLLFDNLPVLRSRGLTSQRSAWSRHIAWPWRSVLVIFTVRFTQPRLMGKSCGVVVLF